MDFYLPISTTMSVLLLFSDAMLPSLGMRRRRRDISFFMVPLCSSRCNDNSVCEFDELPLASVIFTISAKISWNTVKWGNSTPELACSSRWSMIASKSRRRSSMYSSLLFVILDWTFGFFQTTMDTLLFSLEPLAIFPFTSCGFFQVTISQPRSPRRL